MVGLKKFYMLGVVLCLFIIVPVSGAAEDSISIGINMPLTGERQATGLHAIAGVKLLQKQVNKSGGVDVGGKKYKIDLVVLDNRSSPEGAVATTIELITKNNVVAIIGPNASSYAIPSGGIAESFKTPMISPNSTNPKTTLNRPFIFRACFLDDFQGQVMADFATSEFNATKAAVLFSFHPETIMI